LYILFPSCLLDAFVYIADTWVRWYRLPPAVLTSVPITRWCYYALRMDAACRAALPPYLPRCCRAPLLLLGSCHRICRALPATCWRCRPRGNCRMTVPAVFCALFCSGFLVALPVFVACSVWVYTFDMPFLGWLRGAYMLCILVLVTLCLFHVGSCAVRLCSSSPSYPLLHIHACLLCCVLVSYLPPHYLNLLPSWVDSVTVCDLYTCR